MTTPDKAEIPTTAYDSAPDTTEHIRQVSKRLDMVRLELGDRGYWHDASKFGPAEKPLFDEMTPKLKTLVYGSDEYKASLAALGPALQHHYANNSHHPEHYKNGIAGFDLLDLIEMYCDWAAASLRNKDGDMGNSLEFNFKRFGISDQLSSILRNTWVRHGGFAGYENFSVGWKKETDDPSVTECRDWGTGQNFVRTPKPNLPYPPESST